MSRSSNKGGIAQVEQAIRAVALDYIEGWYNGNAGRIDRALSSNLVKRRIVSADEIWRVNKAWMVNATGEGRGRIERPNEGRRDITPLDRSETMASVKIVSEKTIDYLHVAKVDGQWRIADVLWDFAEQI